MRRVFARTRLREFSLVFVGGRGGMHGRGKVGKRLGSSTAKFLSKLHILCQLEFTSQVSLLGILQVQHVIDFDTRL